jgi:putative oxidoreductase
VAKIRYGIGPIEGMLMSKGIPAVLAWPVYLGEVVGPLMLIAGYFARIGAALIVVNMIVAILVAHSGDLLSLTQFGGWQLELQGMYLFTALALALMGPGRFSINRR